MFDLSKNKKSLGIFDDAFCVVDNMFNDIFGPTPRHITLSSMKVDVQETEIEYIVKADLPGLCKEDIKVNVKDNVLTIAVNKEETVNEDKDNYILRERKSAKLSRSFCLDNVYADKIKAKYVDGVLTLNIPKVEPEKEAHIHINIE